MNFLETEPLPSSEESAAIDMDERIIFDVLITEDDTSNGDNSGNEIKFEISENSYKSQLQFLPSPDLQNIDVKAPWSKNMTKALIEECTIMIDHFRTPDPKRRDIWKLLACRMQEKGYQVTWEMCNRKFRNLKQTYRSLKYTDRNGKNKRRWEYYDDLSVLMSPYTKFNTNESISPPLSPISQENFITVETADFFQASVMNCSTNEQSGSNSPQPLHQLRQGTMESEEEPPIWFKEFIMQLQTGQENMLENIKKMHNESKKLEQRKIKLLENILSLMKNKN